ncbi:MAG: hypothetical protein WD045_12550, partial [Pirellulaceae bacterium]
MQYGIGMLGMDAMKNIYVRLGVIGVVVALGATAIAQSLMTGNKSQPHNDNPDPIVVSQLPEGTPGAEDTEPTALGGSAGAANPYDRTQVVLAANETPAETDSEPMGAPPTRRFRASDSDDNPPQPSTRFRLSDSGSSPAAAESEPTEADSAAEPPQPTPADGAAPPSRFRKFLTDSDEGDEQPEPQPTSAAENAPRPRYGSYGAGAASSPAMNDEQPANPEQEDDLETPSRPTGTSGFSGTGPTPAPMRFSDSGESPAAADEAQAPSGQAMENEPQPASGRFAQPSGSAAEPSTSESPSQDPQSSGSSPPARFVGSGGAQPPTASPGRFSTENTSGGNNAMGGPPPSAMTSSDQGTAPRSFSGTTGSAPPPPSTAGGMAVAARPGEARWEGHLTPSLSLEKIAPPEIQIGKKATFELVLQNVGQVEARQVVVRDMVPAGTSLISTSPEAQAAADGSLVWQIDSLSPGEKKLLKMELMPEKEGDVGSVATVSFATMASVKTTVTRPRLSIQQDGASKVLVGDQLRIAVTLNNPGTGPASGVVIEANVPSGFTHQAGNELEFEIGTLKPGETRQLELNLTAAQAARTVNRLVVRADGDLQAEHELDLEVIAPQLEVAINGPTMRYLDRPAKYTVSVTNPGTAPAQAIDLVTQLPKGLQFVEANNAGQYDSAKHAVLWSLEELPPGQTGTVELVALPIEAGDHRLLVEGTAKMGLTAKNESSVKVEGLAAIFFEVADLADPIEVGKESTYEIRVVNQGSKEATDVRVVAQLPAGLRGIKADGATRGVIEGQQVIFEPVSRIEPKGTVQFKIQVQGIAAGDQRTIV